MKKLKVVVAIDSLKGSLSSMEAGAAARDGIRLAFKEAEVVVKPLADGGEGTTDALIEGLGGEKVPIQVVGPIGEKVEAYYGVLPETNTAVIEMAMAAGITLVKEKDPLIATTYGVGEMIQDAIKRGYQNFIIGIGGSATNDGGTGMLTALGYKFFNKQGFCLSGCAKSLSQIAAISEEEVLPELKDCRFQIACDVTNPLYGENGATYVFGPQKGVTDTMKEMLDNGMKQYAKVTADFVGGDYSKEAGAGAAGGLGFAFISYLGGKLVKGTELILEAIGLEEEIKTADYVITGEGKLDEQTMMGKAPAGVAKIAKMYGKKVIAFAGGVTKEASLCNRAGIDAFFPIVRGVTTLEEAMDKERARENMKDTVEQVFRLLI